MSVNKVILVGNLGKDPEIRFTGSGSGVCKFPIATSERWRDKESGEMKERTEWHNITVWGKQGEQCNQYLSKGRQVYIEGGIRTTSYDDKQGQKRYFTEIVAQRVQFLGGQGGAERGASSGAGGGDGPPPPQNDGGPPVSDEDIPF